MSEFNEYIVHGEPGQREKAWLAAISIQDVDGLKVTLYLLDAARQHIKGDTTTDEARERFTPRLPKSQYDTFNTKLS